MKKLKPTGDTIVEVLIAVLIVAIVLTAAYASSIRSQKSTQQAEEHTTALKIAESQLEQLNVEAVKTTSSIYGSPAYLFCFDPATNTLLTSGVIKDSTDSTPVISPMPPINTVLHYHNCLINKGVDYGIAVERSGTNPYLFTVHVRWASIQAGGSQDEVTLTYKVDKS